jgi:hypothetical protein
MGVLATNSITFTSSFMKIKSTTTKVELRRQKHTDCMLSSYAFFKKGK